MAAESDSTESNMTQLVRARRDPDPLVIDLMINIVATGIAGLLVKVGKAVFRRPGRFKFDNVNAPHLPPGELKRLIDEIDRIASEAYLLVLPERPRELGGIILLTPEQIARYHSLREELFAKLRTIDEISESWISDDVEAGELAPSGSMRLPKEFRDHLRATKKRLDDARVASLAGVAMHDIKASLCHMRELVRLIQGASDTNRRSGA
jgi:hypothetical protein